MIRFNCNINKIINSKEKEAGQDFKNLIQLFPFSGLKSAVINYDGGYVVLYYEDYNDNHWDKEFYIPHGEDAQLEIEKYLLEHPLNCVAININYIEKKITLSAGPGTSNTIYLSRKEEKLLGDWDITNHYKNTSLDHIDKVFIGNSIIGENRLSNRTYFKNVFLLVPGTSISFGSDSEVFYTFSSDSTYRAKVWESDYDPVSILDGIISNVVHSITNSGNVGVELSGGLDSALVATIASQHCNLLKSYALILPGKKGQDQQHKRSLLLEHIKSEDYIIYAEQFLPLADINGYFLFNKKIWPKNEIYSYAIEQIGKQASADQIDVILTGIGGDELTKLTLKEQEYLGLQKEKYNYYEIESLVTNEIEKSLYFEKNEYIDVVNGIPSSALSAGIARNFLYLRCGIWPANILNHQSIIEFCHSLPPQYRANRYIIRELLKQREVPHLFAENEKKEGFGELFDLMMKSSHINRIISKMNKDSIVFDLNIIDKNKFMNKYKQMLNGREEPSLQVYTVICMELALRSASNSSIL